MLKELTSLYGVSGLEMPVRSYLEEKIKNECDALYQDGMGNLHAVKHGKGPKVLVTAYMDEPGIIITQITKDGYLRFETVGRIQPAFLVSKRVFINGHAGIISLKAIHLASKEERQTPVKVKQLFVDIGADTREEAEKAVEIGDYGVIDSDYRELENNMVKGRALAGRMSCAAAVWLLEQLHCNLHVIFAVQREIGCRGMQAAAQNVDADFSVVFDAAPTEDKKEKGQNTPWSGDGPVLFRRTGAGCIDPALWLKAKETAKEHGIPIQCCTTKEKGQESVLLQTGNRHRCICLGIPVRYAGSASQIADKKDFDNLKKLSYALIENILAEVFQS